MKPLRALGKELVLFRTASGEAKVLDATCPHLGAHLGVGGRVEGDCVVCPFHGWRFDGSGECQGVPLARRVPPSARAEAWEVRESVGHVLVWHDARRGRPTWEPPAVPEAADPAWTPFRRGHTWRIRTHVQEIAENGMDLAHFPFLHRQQTREIRTESLDVDGPTLVHSTFQSYNLFGLARLLTPEVNGPLVIHVHGPGFIVNRATVHAKIDLDYTFVFFATPIDGDAVELTNQLTMKRLGGTGLATRLLMSKALREAKGTIDQDVPIWESKLWRRAPRLSDADGPVMAYRRWARQFYDEGTGPRDVDAD